MELLIRLQTLVSCLKAPSHVYCDKYFCIEISHHPAYHAMRELALKFLILCLSWRCFSLCWELKNLHRSSEIRQQSPLGEAFANADRTGLTSQAVWLHGLWDDIETCVPAGNSRCFHQA